MVTALGIEQYMFGLVSRQRWTCIVLCIMV